MGGLTDLVSGAVGIGPAMASGAFGSALDLYQMGRASDEASFARDWSAQQYRRRYQDTVNDLRAAGLNPLLAVNGMSASGQASGSAAEVPKVSNPVTTALELSLMREQRDKTTNESEAAWWLGKANRADAYTKSLLFDVLNANKSELTSAKKAETELTRSQVPGAKAEADFWRGLDSMGGTAKGLKELAPLLKILIPARR